MQFKAWSNCRTFPEKSNPVSRVSTYKKHVQCHIAFTDAAQDYFGGAEGGANQTRGDIVFDGEAYFTGGIGGLRMTSGSVGQPSYLLLEGSSAHGYPALVLSHGAPCRK